MFVRFFLGTGGFQHHNLVYTHTTKLGDILRSCLKVEYTIMPGIPICLLQKDKPEQKEKAEKKKPEVKKEAEPAGDKKEKKSLSGGVSIEDTKVGNGPVAKPGKTVMVSINLCELS